MKSHIVSSIVFGAIAIFSSSCEKPKSPVPPPPPVTMVKPMICDVNLYQDYVGRTEANQTVEIKAQVQGVLTAKYFEEGQDVKEGELLFTIDDRPYVAALAQAEAVLAQNLARLQYSEETVKRYASLVKQDYISQLNYDEYLTNFKVDDALIKQNIAEIEQAKVNLSYTRITAPMNSTAGTLNIYPGNLINQGGQQAIITLNQITPIKVSFYIPEKDLQNIQFLQRKGPLKTIAYLYDDQSHGYEGHLYLINNQVNLKTGSIELKALFPNKDKELWPGQFVVLRVLLDEMKNAMLIASQAVQIGQTGPYVYIINEDMTVETRNVILGQRQGEYTIVLNGIEEGEMVVLDGQMNLYNGKQVTITNLPTKTKSKKANSTKSSQGAGQ